MTGDDLLGYAAIIIPSLAVGGVAGYFLAMRIAFAFVRAGTELANAKARLQEQTR